MRTKASRAAGVRLLHELELGCEIRGTPGAVMMRERGPLTEDRARTGLRHGTLRLAPYDPRWSSLYDIEAGRIRTVLPNLSFAIDHIGSTAVPGLPSKPILDIAVRVSEGDEIRMADALVWIGYVERSRRGGRLFIRLREGDVRTRNLPVYRPDDPARLDQIAFRNALRIDANLRDRYAALKRKLVERLADSGRRHYARGKTDFVNETLSRSLRSNGTSLPEPRRS